MPPSKKQLRGVLRAKLEEVRLLMNEALSGDRLRLSTIEPVLARIGRGEKLPHWFAKLKAERTLPNLDGKTIGSVIEMLLVAVLETSTFATLKPPPLKINPARGVDLPDLDLGVKSPSENYCTSEPFFSAYERLYGSEHDVLVLLTDYQKKKRTPPLRLQITRAQYLKKTQIADEALCRLARKHRDFLLADDETRAKKVFRFLAYVNQSDWRARWLLKLLDNARDGRRVIALVADAATDFVKQNQHREKKDRALLSDCELQALSKVLDVRPVLVGVVEAVDGWVLESLKEMGRAPSENEWNRLLASPLDGKIGMSFALQWRYNFGRLFGARERDDIDD
jgi:hypothetical protein